MGPAGTPEQEARAGRDRPRPRGPGALPVAAEGRTARSAVLWVTGTHYDIFGWRNPACAVPAAAAAIREYLQR